MGGRRAVSREVCSYELTLMVTASVSLRAITTAMGWTKSALVLLQSLRLALDCEARAVNKTKIISKM